MTFRGLIQKILISVGLGLVVVFVLGVASDLPKLLHTLATFEWHFIPAILALTLMNYCLRFVKWHFYLHVIGVRNVRLSDSALIFGAGLSMVMTPGKVGELLKSYLIRAFYGTPMSSSAPIIVAERLTDGLAMLILASGGLLLYGIGRQGLIVFLIAAIFVVSLSQRPGLVRRLIGLVEHLPIVASRIQHVEALIESAYQLFRVRNLGFALGLGLISWSGECLAFYLVLIGLGLPPSQILVIQAAFILAVSTLIGAASMLPGGLAATDGSIAGLLLLTGVTHSPAVAAAATLIIRFATLWFGVGVGIVGLFLVSRPLANRTLSTEF